MSKEIWVPIAGYSGFYEISSFGNVKSLSKTVGSRERKTGVNTRTTKEYVRQPEISHAGYCRIVLSKYGKNKKFSVHRLVAEVFHPNPENKPCVNHIDGNPKNNNVSNLEWCTYAENELHSHRVLGKKPRSFTDEQKGEMSLRLKGKKLSTKHREKLSEAKIGKPIIGNRRQVILNGKQVFDSLTNAAKELGCTSSAISNNLTGKSKTTKQGTWEYC